MIIDINHPHVADIICYDRYGRVLKYLCCVDTDTMKGKQYVVYRGGTINGHDNLPVTASVDVFKIVGPGMYYSRHEGKRTINTRKL